MISIRTKCLFVGAAIAPISLLSIFELSLRTARSIQSQEISPQEAARLAQTMSPGDSLFDSSSARWRTSYAIGNLGFTAFGRGGNRDVTQI